MDITVTLPDDSLDAWNWALANYNQSAVYQLTLPEYVNNIIVGAQTATNTSAYASWQLQQLVPLGEKYNAAPDDVKLQVDALLAPYNP